MSLRPYQQAYDVVIRMMAESLILPPAVELHRLGECVDRWRMQRIAEICINEFGDDARVQARRLLKAAGGAQQFRPGLRAGDRRSMDGSRSLGAPIVGDAGHSGPDALAVPSVPMTGRRDGACVSGNPVGGRDAA